MKAFGRRIYIKPEEEKTLLQTGSNTATVRGTVISAGPDCKVVKEGDVLLFTSWGVDEVNVNGEKFYFLLESDEFILATV